MTSVCQVLVLRGQSMWITFVDILSKINSFLCQGLGEKLIADHHRQYKAAGKRTQHCWPTTPNIVGCYILRPFANPVECHWVLLRVFPQSQIGQTFSPVPRNIGGSCFVRLDVALSLTGFKLCATTPTIRNNKQQGVQTDATCNIQQWWELFSYNVVSVCMGL